MPFRSERQRRFLWAKHPEIGKKWAEEYDDARDRVSPRALQSLRPKKKRTLQSVKRKR